MTDDIECKMNGDSFVHTTPDGTTILGNGGSVFVSETSRDTAINTGIIDTDEGRKIGIVEDSTATDVHSWISEKIFGDAHLNSSDDYATLGEAMHRAGITCTDPQGKPVAPPVITEHEAVEMGNGGVVRR